MLDRIWGEVRDQWFGNVRAAVIAGLVVALALIPEAIAFSIIAGVDPKVGLYASFSIAVMIAFVGGRPGMISAATAATAVLMVTLRLQLGLRARGGTRTNQGRGEWNLTNQRTIAWQSSRRCVEHP